jgi:hypothetical protein
MLGELVRVVLERALEAELTAHLGYGKSERGGAGQYGQCLPGQPCLADPRRAGEHHAARPADPPARRLDKPQLFGTPRERPATPHRISVRSQHAGNPASTPPATSSRPAGARLTPGPLTAEPAWHHSFSGTAQG